MQPETHNDTPYGLQRDGIHDSIHALTAASVHGASAMAPTVAAAVARSDSIRSLLRQPGRLLKGASDGDETAGGADDDILAEFDTGTFCHADPDVCAAEGATCYYFGSNPEGNTVSFDSVGAAFMPLLQAVTFDTWTDPMFDVIGAYDFWAWTYFIAAAILGGMFVVNLFLAVIFDEFMRAQVRCEPQERCQRPLTTPIHDGHAVRRGHSLCIAFSRVTS